MPAVARSRLEVHTDRFTFHILYIFSKPEMEKKLSSTSIIAAPAAAGNKRT